MNSLVHADTGGNTYYVILIIDFALDSIPLLCLVPFVIYAFNFNSTIDFVIDTLCNLLC